MQARVSLISTVLNEAQSLPGFLRAVAGQSRKPDEIVIVDGGSADGSAEILQEANGSLGAPLRTLVAEGLNIAEGRNRAIAEAEGDVIVVGDVGAIPDPHWLERLVGVLESDEDADVAAGFYRPGGEDWSRRVLATVITPQREEIVPEKFLPSSRSVAFRRSVWERVGGYPEWLMHCEDLVFDLDGKDAGASFVFVPDAVVTWDARPGLRSFARQYFNYARGDGHADLWLERHLARYLAYLFGFPLMLTGPRFVRPAVLGAAVWYQTKFWRRLRRIPPGDGPLRRGLAYPYSVVIVGLGDVAKMVGYARGTWERRTGRAGRPKPSTAVWVDTSREDVRTGP
jgi:glycosyltransferase involved in cell wall biosynthesis